MKKRRAIFGVILPILTLTLSACDFPTNIFGGRSSSQPSSSRRIRSSRSSSSNSGYPSGHIHQFSEQWSYNSQNHWHDSTCGHDVKDQFAPHDINEQVLVEATCQEPGEKIRQCNICGYEAIVTIPIAPHTWVEVESERIEPTCTQDGLIKKVCSLCGAYSQEILPALGHEYDEVVIREATCTQDGLIKRICSLCGHTEDYYVPAYGHDYETLEYVEGNCSQEGYERLRCKRCGTITEHFIPTSGHVWSNNESLVDTGNGVPYFVDGCTSCGAKKIILATANATITGNVKTTPADSYGYVKLGTNGSNMRLDFEYPESGFVTIYQHAMYDNWRNENYRNASYRSTNSPEPSEDGYNFSMELNGQLVDLTESSRNTYNDFFASSPKYIDELIDAGYSPMADCIIGTAELVPGMNSLTYTRLSAYTLNIDYFILVVSNSAHQHNLSSQIYYDENYHWRQCMDSNCPLEGGRVAESVHQFFLAEEYPADSCCDMAGYAYACSVCNYRNIVYQRSEHSYDESATTYVTNSQSYQQAINHCTKCNHTVQSYQFSVGKVTAGSYDSGRMKQGTTMEWKFPVSKTGVVSLYIPIYVSTQTYLTKTFDPSLYNLAFNGVNYEIYAQYGLYQDLGIKVNEVIYLKFGSYQVTEYDVNTSEITVSLTSNVSEYRPYLDGEIRLEY